MITKKTVPKIKQSLTFFTMSIYWSSTSNICCCSIYLFYFYSICNYNFIRFSHWSMNNTFCTLTSFTNTCARIATIIFFAFKLYKHWDFLLFHFWFESSAENWFWKASLSSWCFKDSELSSTSGELWYSLIIRDSSYKDSSYRGDPDSSSLLKTDVGPCLPFMIALFWSSTWSIPINENFLFDFWKVK